MNTKNEVLKALHCLRLEAPAAVVDDVSRIVLAHIAKHEEALVWCGGSADFGPGGQAREGWLKLCAPLLQGMSSPSEGAEHDK